MFTFLQKWFIVFMRTRKWNERRTIDRILRLRKIRSFFAEVSRRLGSDDKREKRKKKTISRRITKGVVLSDETLASIHCRWLCRYTRRLQRTLFLLCCGKCFAGSCNPFHLRSSDIRYTSRWGFCVVNFTMQFAVAVTSHHNGCCNISQAIPHCSSVFAQLLWFVSSHSSFLRLIRLVSMVIISI